MADRAKPKHRHQALRFPITASFLDTFNHENFDLLDNGTNDLGDATLANLHTSKSGIGLWSGIREKSCKIQKKAKK